VTMRRCRVIASPSPAAWGYYRATVTDLFKRSGKLHVTVGYIPLVNTVDFTTTLSDTPHGNIWTICSSASAASGISPA